MAFELTKLPKTNFSGLEYDNIIDDIIRIVLDNPEYNDNWDDFLSSNAGRMMIELFSYIADQLATRIDWVVNENYIGTTTQKKSVMRILKIIGYNFSLPEASMVPVTVIVDKPVGEFNLTPVYSAEAGELDIFSLTARDKNGKIKTFEALEYDEINRRYEYKTGININTGTSVLPNLKHVINFFEGTTVLEEFVVDTENNQSFTLRRNPVIQDSARVYIVRTDNDVVSEIELTKVEAFLEPEAQKFRDSFGDEIPIPFLLNVAEDDTVNLEFGPTSLLPDARRRPRVGDIIRVFYRIGGGVDGNITRRSISTTKRFSTNNEIINVNFINSIEGSGGRNGESPEHAALFAPLVVRTANKAVTQDDYDILIRANPTVLKSKSYGNTNIPGNIRDIYGIHVKPLEVWNYILRDKPGWREIPPSKYNDFNWIDMRLENRFNEVLGFRKGEFNLSRTFPSTSPLVSQEIEWGANGETNTFKNFSIIDTPDRMKENIYKDEQINTDFLFKLAESQIEEEYFSLISEGNVIDERVKKTNFGLIEAATDTFRITDDISAFITSSENIDGNINMTTNKNIGLGFDNRTQIETIDLTGTVPTATTPAEIVANINDAFINHVNYNNGDATSTKGSQGFGLNIIGSNDSGLSPNTEYYLRINSNEFKITTQIKETITFNDLIEAILEATAFKTRANVSNGLNIITNVKNDFILRKLKKGMKLETESLSTVAVITNVNILTRTITINEESNFTAQNVEIEIYPYDVELVGSDIVITNLQEEPVGPIWIENGTYENVNFNLLTNPGFQGEGFSNLAAITDSTGVKGYQDLGIDGVINETRGYQSFSTTDNPIVNTAGSFSFNLEINGTEVNPGDDLTVTLISNSTLELIVDEINSQLTFYTANATCSIVDGKIRITSDTYGSTSTVQIISAVSQDLVALLGGVDTAIDGENDAEIDIAAGTYYFIINDYEFSVDLITNETFINLVNKINAVIEPNGYEATILPTEWEDEIRITHKTTAWVNIRDGVSGNGLFANLHGIIKIINEEKIETNEWQSFKTPIGGGDYSHVARTYTIVLDVGQEIYLHLESPSKGEQSSILRLTHPPNDSVVFELFGIILSTQDNQRISYGVNRATLNINTSTPNSFGRIIYEIGTFSSWAPTTTNYLNYLYTNDFSVDIGRYYTDNFDEDDPSWRIPATRIYNTAYNSNSILAGIDLVNSKFVTKFTRTSKNNLSIFSIENDWGFNPTSPATTITTANPNQAITDEKYNISINIDNRGYVDIDLSGDQGVSGTYELQPIIERINNTIHTNVNYLGNSLYTVFQYAVLHEDEDKIVFRSPSNDNDGKIKFRDVANDITGDIFIFDTTGSYEQEFNTTGDYYISYHLDTITGDFTIGSDVITNVTTEDIAKAKAGMRVLAISDTINEGFIIEVLENSIRLNIQSVATTSGVTIQISNDHMILNKILGDDSNMPDLEFYFHYIFDRRYVPEFFDGEIRDGYQTPGFPIGSLDEDIYNANLENSKIVGLNHVFKKSRFLVFDIKGRIYYNKIFSPVDVELRVNNSLRDAYKLESREYGESISRSKIMSIIHDNAGVDYIEIDYLGPDSTDISTNVINTIPVRFDELAVLSENISFAGVRIHGIIFDYVISGI